MMQLIVVAVAILLISGAKAHGNMFGDGQGSLAPFPQCNTGPMHHGHLVLPIGVSNADECSKSGTKFFLSHGATFFCPHTWDIKLVASLDDDAARQSLCSSYFENLALGENPIHLFRPTLDQGGLPASALGQLTEWDTPAIYHINSFGTDNDAGPDNGWNMTTIYDNTVTVTIDKVAYSRQFELQPAPAHLTYLVHAPLATEEETNTVILSHYISTGGDAGFDHITTVKMLRTDGENLVLRASWPLYVTFDKYPDAYIHRLKATEGPKGDLPRHTYHGHLHIYDTATGLPTQVEVEVQIVLDYYHGTSDGFAGFGTVCPNNVDAPNSPTMCMSN
jgi:hypothetical protein